MIYPSIKHYNFPYYPIAFSEFWQMDFKRFQVSSFSSSSPKRFPRLNALQRIAVPRAPFRGAFPQLQGRTRVSTLHSERTSTANLRKASGSNAGLRRHMLHQMAMAKMAKSESSIIYIYILIDFFAGLGDWRLGD